MITCPLCQQPVYLDDARADEPITLEDTDTDDFHCNNRVEVFAGIKWRHYHRRTQQGWYPEYYAQIPPFRVHWVEDRELIVERLTHIAVSSIHSETIQRVEKANFQDFLHLIERVKILVPFS